MVIFLSLRWIFLLIKFHHERAAQALAPRVRDYTGCRRSVPMQTMFNGRNMYFEAAKLSKNMTTAGDSYTLSPRS
jgi:hypothetical protein